MPDRALSGDFGAGKDQLPPAEQEDRQPHQVQEGRRRDRREVEADDIIKGYEVSKGEYIELEPEELEAVAIESRRTIDIC